MCIRDSFWVCPKGYARTQVETGRNKPVGKWFEPLTKYAVSYTHLEMAYGRGMKSGPVGAFSKAMEMRFGNKGKTWGKIIGMIPVIGSLGIAIGYSVVVGWFLKYLFSAVTGSLLNVENMGAYFGELAVDFLSLIHI